MKEVWTKPKPYAPFGSVALSASVESEFKNVWQLVETYRKKLKGEKVSTRRSAPNMLEDIVQAGVRFLYGEKVYKIAAGMIFSNVKATVDPNTYEHLCKDRFKLTPPTADRYALIFDAWVSGQFLYSLPEGYNFLDLSVRDMETGAELIVAGEFSEERAHILFGDGDWATKREAIREDAPVIVERNTKPVKDRSKLKVVGGDLLYLAYDVPIRFGTLLIDDPDPIVRTCAKRALRSIQKEFKAS